MLSPAERARLVLKVRSKQDACKLYVPNPIQALYLNSRARYRIGVGVNRGGKSTIMAYELAAAARRIHPTRSTTVNGTYLLFCPKRSQLNEIWAKKLLRDSELANLPEPCPFIPEWEIDKLGYTYGAGLPTIKDIRLKNGNSIACFPSDTQDVWRKVEGLGMVLGIGVDEAVGDSNFLSECATRLLDANSNDKVVADCGGGWLCWNGTQNKDNPPLDQLVDNITNFPLKYDQFAIFRLTSDDNKTIKVSEREKLRLLMSDEQYAVRMDGTESVGGQMRVFPQWSDKRHWITDPTQVHIPSDKASFWLGYDPGVNHTGMVMCCIEPEAPRTLRVVHCWQTQRCTIEYDVLQLRKYLRGRFLEGIVYDQASKQAEKVGDNVASKLARVLQSKAYAVTVKRGMCQGVSSYKSSVPILRQYLDPDPRDKTVAPFITVNGDIESGCHILRSQMLFQHFTTAAHELKEQAISKGNDHCLDALRYLCTLKPYYTKRGENPCLWPPGEDPEDGNRHNNYSLVMSDEAIRMETLMNGSRLIANRRLAKLRNRSRR